MSADYSRMAKHLDDLGLALVVIDPEDLIALGELLEKTESALELAAVTDIPGAVAILNGMKKAVEAVILDQVPDKPAVMDVLGSGASLLQETIRRASAGAATGTDLSDFALNLKKASGVDLALPAGSSAPAAAPQEIPEPAAASGEKAETMPSDGATETDNDLFFGFVSESLEHIESIEVHVISLEQNPEDKNTINAVFRPFHTIKGVSGFLNLRQIHHLTHNVENVLDDARNDRLKVTPALIDVVLDAVDILKRMILDVQSAHETGAQVEADYGLEDFIARIKAVQQGYPVEKPEAHPSAYNGWMLGEILLDQGMVTSEELYEILASQEDGRLRLLGEFADDRGLISPEDLEEALRLQAVQPPKKIGEILVETGKASPQAISSAIEEQATRREQKLGEILIRQKKASARDVAEALREQKRPSPENAAGQSVKVDTAKLDSLVDMVGELVIAQSLISSNTYILSARDQKLLRDLGHMSRITSELQRTAMSMRMVQIRQTFQKMIRLVRDLTRKSGKKVDLVMSGEETEIDRNMVEAIYDPLVHMVRNSLDHGIETPEKRREAGKPEEGRLMLRAYHQGGNVVIEIVDDGRGLDRDRILEKAVNRGLIAPDEHISDSAVLNLIFQPGFSTAEKVTDVSGRGVGMDVVKRAIENLRGKIELSSLPGQGSTITLRLPLTLAIIDGMIVRVGENRYILPTIAIHESFRPGKDDYHTVSGRGEMIKVRNSLLPLVRLGQILGVRASRHDPTEALVVVVENEGKRRCIMVDEVIGKQEVVIKNLGERLKNIRALAGGSILGDGRVGLILDIAGVFGLSEESMGGGPEPSGTQDGDWEMDQDWGMEAL